MSNRLLEEAEVASALAWRGEAGKAAVRIVLILVVAIPISIILSRVLHKVFHFNSEAVGIITSAILSYAIASLHRAVLYRIVESVPVQTLGLHFGSKLEEAISAFRRTTKPQPRNPAP